MNIRIGKDRDWEFSGSALVVGIVIAGTWYLVGHTTAVLHYASYENKAKLLAYDPKTQKSSYCHYYKEAFKDLFRKR